MRHLVLKLPKGKVPFIGIQFDLQGVMPPSENIDLILEERYKNAKWELYIEFINYGMRIKLVCLEKLIIRDYTDIILDLKAFKEWLAVARRVGKVKFGHVRKVNREDVIVRTYIGEKPVVFEIQEIKMLTGIPG